MWALFENIALGLSAGRPLILVTVLSARGSVPGKVGAMLLAGENGRICGTVGGGALEHRAVSLCRERLREKKSWCERLALSDREAGGLGMLCGGEIWLSFFYLSPEDRENIHTSRKGLALLKEKKMFWLVIEMQDGMSWLLSEKPPVPSHPSGPVWSEKEKRFACPLLDAGRVYIFGGGHVACELVPVLAHVGFRCVIIEDRAEFALPSRFPDAEEVIQSRFDGFDGEISISAADYVVIMTRGHQWDMLVQEKVLRTDAAYIGVMGSRRKKKMVRETLRQKGFTEAELDRVITPVGLPILAGTPEEIAVSIAAQLIQVRAERRRA